MEAPKTRKGGRPPKADREKKTRKIDLKLTEEDYNRLEQLYLHSGYRNRSEMYHDMLLNKTLRQKESGTLEMLKTLQELTREVKAIGAEYRKVSCLLEAQTEDATVAGQLQKLADLTTELSKKELEMFQIIVKLREKWLRES